MKALVPTSGGTAPRPRADWDEAALLAALRQDDELAFAEIYRRHWAELLQVARYKLASPMVAEELIQDLFAGLWNKRHEQAIQKLGPYLQSALRYQIIDFIRASTVRADYLSYCQFHSLAADHNTEEALAANDLSAALAGALGRLPTLPREVFQLSRFEHQTVGEIAGRLHMSPKMVEYHLTKALKILRAGLREFIVGAVLLAWFQ